MRKPHFLSQNANGERPTRLVFVDTETKSVQLTENQEQAVLFFGYAVYERLDTKKDDWIRFDDNETFWNWLFGHTATKTKTYVFAHNLGGFDLMVLEFADYLAKNGWVAESCVLECPPTIIVYHKDDRSLVFCDTLNWFRSSLKQIGESIGFKKLMMPEENAAKEVWDAYCKQDVKIMQRAMHDWLTFCDLHDLGNFKTTLPSQALAAYRHRFMNTPLFCDSNEKALKLDRESYYGGRTDCFYVGKEVGEYYLLDVNSMYPYVMSNNLFPTQLVTCTGVISKLEYSKFVKEYFIIARVRIITNESKYPYRYDGKLIFPVGKFDVTLAQPEIDLLDVDFIYTAALYKQSEIFKNYVKYFYNLKCEYRKKNNDSYLTITKLMLNSLYGKFGQRGFVYENIGETGVSDFSTETIIDADNGAEYTERSFGGIRQRLTQEGESANSIPAIASAVCSYSRAYLYKLIKQAGENNVYYCDTDSIVVNKPGKDKISNYIGDELGQLKIEKIFTQLNIRTVKDYKFDDTERIKGIRKDAELLGENCFRQSQFRSLKGALRDGDVNRMIISKVKKTLTRKYDKGILTESGWIKPIRIGEFIR